MTTNHNIIPGLDIAIIGMAGQFPGAKNIAEFWENLKNGRESISFFSDQELEKAGISPGILKNPNYVKAKSIIEDIEFFDASFFGYTPREAQKMDPQIRVFHQLVWQVLEDAGYDPGTYEGSIGLYAGASNNTAWEVRALDGDPDAFISIQLTDKDQMSTRISHKLNLTGPSFILETQCSTSLVAFHLACQGLLSGECEMALAGGISITLPVKSGYIYQEGMIFSQDGHVRAFDKDTTGTQFGNGVGIVLIKRIEDAIADRDHIYAVVKGTAINNDGNKKVSYSAPSVEGQVEVIRTAHGIAQVEPESITYVETHGTGTSMGDSIEIEALKLAFDTDKKGFCRIGSVKSNVGHLNNASGITSLIKTVLAMKHRLIPSSINFNIPNPKIDFENSPFLVNTQLYPWKSDGYPLRAGVNSFGVGGTNVHVILEEFPEGTGGLAPLPDARPSGEYQLILLSAKTQSALDKMTENLAEYLKKNLLNPGNHENPTNPGLTLADVAYTLQVGRRVFKYRRMVVCPNDVNEVIDLLSSPPDKSRKVKTYCCLEENPPIVFIFPGLGGQYVNMGRQLYEKEPLFRQEMERCFEILNGLVDYDIKEILYPDDAVNKDTEYSPLERGGPKGQGVSEHDIHHFEIAQLVIYIFEYALAKCLIQWGIKPQAMIGYSFGEYTAACISGVFALEDALKLVAARGRLIQKMPEGAMLSVPLPINQVKPLLNDELSLSIDNGPSCIVSGPNEVIAAFEKQMKEKKILCMRVPATRAIHSKMTIPILKELQKVLDTIPLNKPQIPYISNVTGDWLTDEQAVNPGYWTKQLRQTVRFNDGMKTVVKEFGSIFVEIGPGRDISALTARYFQENNKSRTRVINLVRHPHQNISDVYFLLNKIGHLWLYGQSVDWSKFYSQEKRWRIPLPTYPFEGQRYWIDENVSNRARKKISQKSREDQPEEFDHWFYTLSWKRSLFITHKTEKTGDQSTWLVFVGEHSLGSQLVQQLHQLGEQVTAVGVGTGFTSVGKGQYTINPKNKEDYQTLLSELKEAGTLPTRVIHLWGITRMSPGIEITGQSYQESNRAFASIDHIQELGFYSLVYFTQALGKLRLSQELQVVVVTNDMQEVTGKEKLHPGKSTVLGPVKVIPQEHPSIICRSVDITSTEPEELSEKELIRQLLQEFTGDSSETVIAYRGPYRWVQIVEPRHMEEEGTKDAEVILKDNGVYLLTGGLGEIGLVLAEYLAKRVKARLVLTGRSSFLSRDQWDQWLDNHDQENLISAKIKKLKHLEELGGEIMLSPVDTADYPRMQETITTVEEQWGPINGVIHLAGITRGPTFAPTAQISKTACQEHFRAKIYGLLVLEKIFREKPLDFCWLISSIASILGGLGYVAYSAANNFMDAFVCNYNRLNTTNTINNRRWISVNWDILEPEQMRSAFQRISALDKVNQVLISTGGRLQQRINRWIKLESVRQDKNPVKKESTSYPRPDLTSPYEAPTNSYQQKIVDFWQQLFGFEPIGTQDDFFELGGDSLKAISVIAQIHKELNVEIPISEFFDHPTVKELAEYINRIDTETRSYSAIEPGEKKEYYLASAAQRRLYFLQQMEPESKGYNESKIVWIEGKVDRKQLEEAFKKLIRRHEIYRTSLKFINSKIVQKVHPFNEIEFSIDYHEAREDEARKVVKNFVKPFDLSKAPILRVGLIKISDLKHVLMLDMHHIITDKTSDGILTREFMVCYQGRTLPPLYLQYKDYAQWQSQENQQKAIKDQQTYWLKTFTGELPILHLPTDFPRPEMQSFEGDGISFRIDKNQEEVLKSMASRENVTLFMVLISILNVLLGKLSGQEDIIIGTPVAGRRQVELQNLVGIFVNTVVMRNYPAGEKTYSEFLHEIREHSLEAFENQDYPFEEIIDEIEVERDLSRNPLFDVMFILQNMDERPENLELKIPDFKIMPYQQGQAISKFDLMMVIDSGNHLAFYLEYCTKLFKRETIERLIGYFRRIISFVLEHPEERLSQIEFISGKEKEQLLYTFNNTGGDYPKDKTIHRLFEEQVEITPDHIALLGQIPKGVAPPAYKKSQIPDKEEAFGQMHLSYRKLNEKSNQLAWLLREKCVEHNNIVAIMVERTIQMMAGILGILKAGGAYLPIDPDYPSERVKYMLTESATKFLLLDEVAEQYPGKEGIIGIQLSYSPLAKSAPKGRAGSKFATSPAYVIYTSGSTGRPKGVMIRHRSVINFFKGMTDVIDFNQRDSILSLTTICFDIFGLETLLPLTRGCKVVIGNTEQQLNASAAGKVMELEKVTILQVTPSRLSLLIAADEAPKWLKSLKYLLVGGEAFPEQLLARTREVATGKIYNLYGPTETTIWSTVKDVSQGQWLNIGKPIANTQVYIVDKYHRVQLLGVPGELLIGGDGVATGYLNNPELTAEKFDHDLSDYQDDRDKRKKMPGKRIYMSYMSYMSYIYRTGDLARWLADGNIEFLGRMDYQVKIRGFRIELGEIENNLLRHNEIKEAVVQVREDQAGDKHLYAYIVKTNDAAAGDTGGLNVSQLREYLSDLFPTYMVPSYFIWLEQIPLTPNGKVDKKALPKPGDYRPEVETTYRAPQTENQGVIAQLWQEVLGTDKVGIYDNFFDLGGNSLKLIQLNRKLQERFNQDIPMTTMFMYSTIDSLAGYLSREGEMEEAAVDQETISDIKESLEVMGETISIMDGLVKDEEG